jgi:hypothetical protein
MLLLLLSHRFGMIDRSSSPRLCHRHYHRNNETMPFVETDHCDPSICAIWSQNALYTFFSHRHWVLMSTCCSFQKTPSRSTHDPRLMTMLYSIQHTFSEQPPPCLWMTRIAFFFFFGFLHRASDVILWSEARQSHLPHTSRTIAFERWGPYSHGARRAP